MNCVKTWTNFIWFTVAGTSENSNEISGSKMIENFLTSWATIIFLRSTLLDRHFSGNVKVQRRFSPECYVLH